MERTGLQKTWVRILLTVMTLAVMGMIYLFSTETAEESDETSWVFAEQVVKVIHPNYDNYDSGKKMEIYYSVQELVRKTAHYTEYALLGLLMRLCLESWLGKRRGLNPLSWAVSTLYASTDELHQILIDGRSGQWADILLDSIGVLSGVLIAALALCLVRKRIRQKETETACP